MVDFTRHAAGSNGVKNRISELSGSANCSGLGINRPPLRLKRSPLGHLGKTLRIARAWGEEAAKVHREYAAARDEFRAALRAVVPFHHPGARAAEIDRACAELLGLLR